MAKTVADQIVEVLAAANVQRIYGIVGDSLNGFTDSLCRHGGVQWLHTRHEEAAAFAAGAEAHVTGRLAVCPGSCGPSNLHLINGLFDCQCSRVSIVATPAHIPSPEFGSGYFQEAHPEQLFLECSSYCELLSSPAQMRACWRSQSARCGRELRLRRGHPRRRGAPASRRCGGAFTAALLLPAPVITSPPEAIAGLADMLNDCERVTLLCGREC